MVAPNGRSRIGRKGGKGRKGENSKQVGELESAAICGNVEDEDDDDWKPEDVQIRKSSCGSVGRCRSRYATRIAIARSQRQDDRMLLPRTVVEELDYETEG